MNFETNDDEHPKRRTPPARLGDNYERQVKSDQQQKDETQIKKNIGRAGHNQPN